MSTASYSRQGTPLALRPYQQTAVAEIERACAVAEIERACAVAERILLVVPPGGGKSLIIAEACHRLAPRRVLNLTHVKELVAQNATELLTIWPGAPAGICCAGLGRFDTGAQLIFASVQTAQRRIEEIGAVDVVMVDEAHLIPRDEATRYRVVLARLNEMAGRQLPLVGLTGTPYRMDSGRLDRGADPLFDRVALDVPITDLVENGWLAPLVSKAPHERLSVDGVHTRGGEYIAAELQAAVDRPDVNRRAVAEMVARGADRRAWLVFCAGVEHAEHVAGLLTDHGIRAATVFGHTPRAERDQAIAAFRAGQIRALVNVDVLATGFNVQAVDLLAVLRPTASPGLHVQMLGRGTRTAPGKMNALVLDFAGNVARHGPLADVQPPRARRPGHQAACAAPLKVCPACDSYAAREALACPDCGHKFARPRQPELSETAAAIDPLYTRAWWPVRRVTYRRHQKPGKPPVLRVGYQIEGGRWVNEWLPLESKHRVARIKAHEWWKQRADLPLPHNVDAALRMTSFLRAPVEISLARDGDFARVAAARFGEPVS